MKHSTPQWFKYEMLDHRELNGHAAILASADGVAIVGKNGDAVCVTPNLARKLAANLNKLADLADGLRAELADPFSATANLVTPDDNIYAILASRN